MPNKTLRLSKATRTHLCKTFHLLPHQLLAAEQTSLRNRLEDTKEERLRLLQQIDETEDRQGFNHLLKKELPKIDRLIERLTNELYRLSNDYSTELQKHTTKNLKPYTSSSSTTRSEAN
jgi:predicted RNase H-like nuclease (RuvC/YqgF family)